MVKMHTNLEFHLSEYIIHFIYIQLTSFAVHLSPGTLQRPEQAILCYKSGQDREATTKKRHITGKAYV